MVTRKFNLPPFLAGSAVTQEIYVRWLRNKTDAHVKRDRKRGNAAAMGEAYRDAIHAAVLASNGRDAYTGEILQWYQISKYDNDESAANGRHYKKGFTLLPTVDHVGDGMGPADFKICSWRTNDTKHDLDMPEFLALCRAVLVHHGFEVRRKDSN